MTIKKETTRWLKAVCGVASTKSRLNILWKGDVSMM
jgi:hypothetical protein